MSGRPLAERVADLLLRQARRRAPGWVVEALEGTAEKIEEDGDVRLRVSRETGERFEIEVHLIPPVARPTGRGPWKPEGIDPGEKLSALSYLVVDEIVGDVMVVSVAPWPDVDDRGRLVFAEEPAIDVPASARALERYLGRTDFRSAEPLDALRTGDAFAAKVRRGRIALYGGGDAGGGAPPPPSAWLVPPVYDIRPAAREKAKEAFYAAVAPTLSPKEAERLEQLGPGNGEAT